jgi:V/A-type H+-transporting ATPase subunit D
VSRRVAATRQNLLRSRRRLSRVAKGRDLLRRKREALVAELFRIARPAVDARVAIHERSAAAYRALAEALAMRGGASLATAAVPGRELQVSIEPSQTWGVAAAEILGLPAVSRTLEARGMAPGSSGPAVVHSAEAFEVLTRLLLESASRELMLRRLGEALAQTSRQVNMLEQRLTPRLTAQLRQITRTLGEREREERVRQLLLVRKREATVPEPSVSGLVGSKPVESQ